MLRSRTFKSIFYFTFILAFANAIADNISKIKPDKNLKELKIAVAAPVYKKSARTIDGIKEIVSEAKRRGAEVVALPQECVLLPKEGEAIPGPTSNAIAELAKDKKIYIVANLREKDGNKTFLTSFMLSPEGKIIAKYRKTHGYSWERKNISLGGSLPVFDTPLGKIGFMIGSDIHFPEVAMTYAWKGARLLFWSTEPEPVRDLWRLEQILRLRASDELLFIAASDYAGEGPYYTHNGGIKGRIGSPIGRACIVNPAGEFLADTSYSPGLAIATIYLPQAKENIPFSRRDKSPLTGYPRHGSYLRQIDMKTITEKISPAPKPEYKKRQAKIILFPGMPNNRKLIEMAQAEKPDLILLPEYGGVAWTEKKDTFEKKNLPELIKLAKENNCYVVAGGIKGEYYSNAYIFDRTGKIIGKHPQITFGTGAGVKVFDLDFGRIGIITCNDMMHPEISRAAFLKGAELLLCPSQFNCPSGMHNHRIISARAIDNAAYIALVQPCTRDPWQRASLCDPYGIYTALGAYNSPCKPVVCQIDLSQGTSIYSPGEKSPTTTSHTTKDKDAIPKINSNLREEILAARRPELYKCLSNPAGVHPLYENGKSEPKLPGKLADNIALEKKYTMNPRPNHKNASLYRNTYQKEDPGNEKDLTDGKLSTAPIKENGWVVWSSHPKNSVDGVPAENVEILLDLDKVQSINYICVHLFGTPTWGAPFPELEVSKSNDNREFRTLKKTNARKLGLLEPPSWPRTDWFITGPFKTKARYIKLLFKCKKEKGIAIDEIAVF